MAECKCKRMARVMRALGATHAASMHDNLGKKWSNQDWLTHFREEETYIFPIMWKLGMKKEVNRLLREHDKYRDQIARYGHITDKEGLVQHALLEDQAAVPLEKALGIKPSKAA